MNHRGYRIEGFAIVSADGMIADADGAMPPALRNEADWRYFQAALDRAAVIVLGRLAHHRHANAGRRRLVLTRSVAALAPDPADPRALLWNPAGAPFEMARLTLGIRQGVVAVTGGTEVFDVFLGIGYDAFHLSRATRCRLPGGRPAFASVAAGATPEDVLRASGLQAGPLRLIDPAAGVTLTVWQRGEGAAGT